jgi:hypothetical protein
MRIHKLEYTEIVHVLKGIDTNGYEYTPEVIAKVEWFTSERKAAVRRLELFRFGKLGGKKREAKIWGVDIPTDHVGLVEWLNDEWGK